MTQNLDRVKELLGNRRAKALAVAVLILVTVVIMQVGNLKNQKSMCELFGNFKLRNIDLQRMQIALSKSGLSEFEIDGSRILVPKAKMSAYLQAIADQKAIPPELRSAERESVTPNPFLSRSQQQLMEREEKKRQIQEMVVRLPFVEQAWFEMDGVENRSAFSKSKKSAVISIRPVAPKNLLGQHVDTVRQMIAGGVAGLDPNHIAVIDLSTGFAHRHADTSDPSERRLDTQRVAFAKQQMLENRIRKALNHYPEVRVTVIVENVEDVDLLASEDATKQQLDPPAHMIPATLSAGANGQASIFEISVVNEPLDSVKLATHESQPVNKERVTVVIDVPQSLLAKIYGTAVPTAVMSNEISEISLNEQTEANFAKFQAEIQQLVRPLIGTGVQSSMSFNLLRQPLPPANQFSNRLQAFTKQNWPSIAVLLIGMILIYLITQTDNRKDSVAEQNELDTEAEVLAINSAENSVTLGENKRAAEKRLSELIDKNPDAAAKVIQNWIRDAA